MIIVFNQLVAFGPLFQDVLNQTQALERFNFISLAVMIEAAETGQTSLTIWFMRMSLDLLIKSIKRLLSWTQNI